MKKLICIVVAVLGAVLVFTGCSDQANDDVDGLKQRVEELEEENQNLKDRMEEMEKRWGIYLLDEAYEANWISHKNLEEIAGYFNGEIDYSGKLDDTVELLIKETAVRDARNAGIVQTDVSGFEVTGFFGEYSGCYVILINNSYIDYPADIVDKWVEIDGVRFHYRGHELLKVWKQNKKGA